MSRSMMREPQRFPFTRLRPIASSIAFSFLSSASGARSVSTSITLLTNHVFALPSGSLSYRDEARTMRVPGSLETFSMASAVFALRSPRFDPMPMCTRCGMRGPAAPRGRDPRGCYLAGVRRSTPGVAGLGRFLAASEPRLPRASNRLGTALQPALGQVRGGRLRGRLVDESGTGRWPEERRHRGLPAEVVLDERDSVAQ